MAASPLGYGGTPGAGFPGPYDCYVPNHEASGGLLVGFSRNKEDFPVNNYCQLFPSAQMFGVYAAYTSRNAARIISPTDAEHVWADGDPRPPGLNNLESFLFLTYKCVRRAYTFTLGDLTVEQMSFDLLMAYSRDMAQQMMTARTMLVQAALSGTSWGSNTAAVDGGILASGQNWTNGGNNQYSTASGPNILLSIQQGIQAVHKQTIGTVREDKLALVVNPPTAQGMAASAEIRDYIKQDQFALGQVKGNIPGQNAIWGLPDRLYGVKLIVEDAVRVSSRKGEADVIGYVMPNNIAYLLAVDGDLVGIAGHRSFSNIQLFFYKDEATVETLYSVNDRRYIGSLVTNYVPVIATVYSGYQFTSTNN